VSPDAVYQRIPKAITELRENYAMFIFTDNGLKPPPEFFKDDRSFMKYIKLGENIDVNKYPWADEVGPIEFFL
jgi:hypothetical protein